MKRIIALATLTILTACSNDQCNNASVAEVMAQKFVKRDLRDPESAVFSNVEAKSDGQCKFTVYGAVSARNGFGGMRNSIFIKRLKYNPETNRWSAMK